MESLQYDYGEMDLEFGQNVSFEGSIHFISSDLVQPVTFIVGKWQNKTGKKKEQ